MERTWIAWVFVAETILLTGLGLVLPRLTRRGLLFGSYVGESSSGPEAAAIRRRWDRSVAIAGSVAIVVAVALATMAANPMATLIPIVPLTLAIVLLYLRCHREARELAARMPIESAGILEAAVPASRAGATSERLPWVSLLLGIAGGLVALVYTIQSYDAMPARVPVHFGLSGAPDGWATRSIGTVFIVPVMTLVTAIILGGTAILTAHVPLHPRAGQVSVEAQQRFRGAVARFLAVVGIITSTMMATMSIFTTRTAIGAAPGLPVWSLALAGALLIYTVGGAIYLMVHYGQGGARLETHAAGAPLAGPLADDRLWKLGVFYVNPADRSWLVEKRFGFGYTLNFGNRIALATCITVVLLVLGLALWAVLSM